MISKSLSLEDPVLKLDFSEMKRKVPVRFQYEKKRRRSSIITAKKRTEQTEMGCFACFVGGQQNFVTRTRTRD